MSALVHGSPVYHRQHLLGRRLLLCRWLEPSLCSITFDAPIACQSGAREFSKSRTRGKVLQFLKSYQNQRSLNNSLFTDISLSADDIGRMLIFHISIVKDFTQKLFEWALRNLDMTMIRPRLHEPPSKTEKTRIMCALYRFEVCCNLFGAGLHGAPEGSNLDIGELNILKNFFCLFEPCKVEEICCVYAFAKETYNHVFHRLEQKMDEENPIFENQSSGPREVAFDLENIREFRPLLACS